MLSMIKNVADVKVETTPGVFHIKAIKVLSGPGMFIERINVQCDGDMKVEIGAYDMDKFGISRAEGTNGEMYYMEENPEQVSDSNPVQAQNGTSACQVVIKLQPGPDGTLWHGEINASTSSATDSPLPTKMEISDIQTNWPGAYEKGAKLPLANIGSYKLLLTVK